MAYGSGYCIRHGLTIIIIIISPGTHQVHCTSACVHFSPLLHENDSCSHVRQEDHSVHEKVHLSRLFWRKLLKIIGKEFQKIVIRRYLERSMQKKFFSNLHSLQIKTIFQEKSSFAKIYCRGICDLYLWPWRHSLVPLQASGANCECC